KGGILVTFVYVSRMKQATEPQMKGCSEARQRSRLTLAANGPDGYEVAHAKNQDLTPKKSRSDPTLPSAFPHQNLTLPRNGRIAGIASIHTVLIFVRNGESQAREMPSVQAHKRRV